MLKEELAEECDYLREASFGRKFGESAYLGNDSRFKVPWVWEGSTDRVLVMEYVDGVSVGGSTVEILSQQDRNDVKIQGVFSQLLAEIRSRSQRGYSSFVSENYSCSG